MTSRVAARLLQTIGMMVAQRRHNLVYGDVWSPYEVVRIGLERCGIGFPRVTNALEGCFPLQCRKVFGEVVGGDKAEPVSLEASRLS